MWHVWRIGESKFRVLVGRPEGNKQHGKPRRRRDDNIKISLQEGRPRPNSKGRRAIGRRRSLQEMGWEQGLDSSGSG